MPKEEKQKKVAASGQIAIKHADAVIMTATGSCNAKPCRMDIQGNCLLADGSHKTIGIFGMHQQEGYGKQLWNMLLERINDERRKYTKACIFALRDELLASEACAHLGD